VGEGTVTGMGYDKDAGNFVKISHMNKYETIYMHLSAFAKGLSAGSAVRQGQLIAFVGQTGCATGPHLDFRMKKNGSYVNPLKEFSPRAGPVAESELARFMAVQADLRSFLEEKRKLAEYSQAPRSTEAEKAGFGLFSFSAENNAFLLGIGINFCKIGIHHIFGLIRAGSS
jgi:murein DD-endopeptidase MepM/ murein hydrolase activator NlpD